MAARREITKAPPGRQRRWRRKLWLPLVAVAAILAGWRALEQHALTGASIPVRPSLAGWPLELEEGIGSAEGIARGYFRPARGLAQLSRFYHANGFYNEALQCYDGLRRLQPREPRWPHLEATILAGFGRIEDALPLGQRAAALAPKYVPARLRLGNLFLKQGKPGPASEIYREALQLDPGNSYALLGLARCEIMRHEWPKARDYLAEAIRSNPDFVGALSLMVTVAEHFGDQAEADRLKGQIGRREFADLPDPWVDELMEECYDPYRLSVAAAVMIVANNPVAARQWLERATALAPDVASYHRQLGLLLSHVPDYPGARWQLQKAVELLPTDTDSWLLLYQLLTQMKENDAAAKVLASGLAHCPQSASLHLEQAHRLNSAGLREQAVDEFREAYRLQPSEAGPLAEMASVLIALGRDDEARAALHEALEKQPEHPVALAVLTFYAIGSGDEPGALQWWEHVRRQTRTPPPVVKSLRAAFRQRFGHELP